MTELYDVELDRVSSVADRLDNVIHSMKLPLAPELHLLGLRTSLPEILKELRAAIAGLGRAS